MHLTDINGTRRGVGARAGLDDVRIHNMRHSFASRALSRGHSLTMISKLLGHRQPQDHRPICKSCAAFGEFRR